MSSLTAALYGALVLYLGGWFLGYWTGDFALLLFILTSVTLLFWLAERFRFKPAREAAAARLETEDAARRAQLASQGIQKVDGDVAEGKARLLAQPWWLDWTAGLFPVILVVFLLRSFLFEPFKIPSGSMIPTLLVGDLILVNKFDYGIRLPVINKKIIANHDPQRGDVMVFRYPLDPRVDYIKRVVGVPGDVIHYANQKLTINGQPVPEKPLGDYYNEDQLRYSPIFEEQLGAVRHKILVDPNRPSYFGSDPHDFPLHQNCQYGSDGMTCKVPPGHYFMMGDNRDDSEDSRFWGFVPDANIVGRAFFVWMNLGNLGRIGPIH
ncbi:MAG: signal peptidase I [Burkholderiales bacterium]|nr:signal peptidase I [Burkholderiales bacterium]MDE2397348.1 signal peptidase I [Burkholderiales bacterium]MDE2452907.1 signal peptidase I [Burkholderiales bacterium]